MEGKHRGLILEPIQPEDHIFGAFPLQGITPLNPSGDWTPYLPKDEKQFTESFDSMSCTSFGTTNCIELLMKQQFGLSPNYSDRFLSKVSGTTEQGNTPKKVADAIRKIGLIPEEEWPLDGARTWAEYMADIPKNLFTLASTWIAEYVLNYEFVSTHPAVLKEALKHSPLGISNNLFHDGNGLYYKPEGQRDIHWATLVKIYENGDYLIYDHYEPFLKRVKAGTNFEFAYRYKLIRQVKVDSWFKKFLSQIYALVFPERPAEVIVDHSQPTVPPAPSKAEMIVAEAQRWLNGEPTPNDEVPDDVACVASLVKVLKPVVDLGDHTYTPLLKAELDRHPDFKRVSEPSPGCVIVSPTRGENRGHCGVLLTSERIASNNSFGGKKGLWTDNYSYQNWLRYFEEGKGLPTFIYAPTSASHEV